MLRILFLLLLLIHGLIHLLGFIREFHLAGMSQFAEKTLLPLSPVLSRAAGIGWLLVTVLFIISSILFLMKKEGWWALAALAVAFSHILIILYWKDAKYGTLANIMILLVIFPAYGSWKFNRMVKEEIGRLLPAARPDKDEIITAYMFRKLPASVQRWMERAHVAGKKCINTVHLEQKGEMRTKEDGRWMKVHAEQYYNIDKPGFIWSADVLAAPGIHLYGRDKYMNGKGHMLIRLLALFPVADSKGKEIDQGTLLRYLAEMVWFPTAALSHYITWEELDDRSAKATMSYGGVTASGTFRFNSAGDVVSFEAQRYYSRKEGPTLETWLISMDDQGYREFEGIRIPASAQVTWKLKSGDFTWYKLEITGVKYNEPVFRK